MEVRVFKPPESEGGPFEILGITELCETVSYKSGFYGSGRFALSMPWGAETADAASTLALGNVVLIDKRFAGQIEAVSVSAGETGRTLEILGSDVLGLASRALCVHPDFRSPSGTLGIQRLSGRAETLIKQLWRDNITSPPQTWRRPVYGLVLAPDLGRGQPMEYNAPPDCSVAETCHLLAAPSRLGLVYRQELHAGRILIDVREGVDRTGHQSANEPVVFSFDRRTLRNLTREQSAQGSANTFFGASSKADVERGAFTVSRANDAAGWARREKYLSVDVEIQDNAPQLLMQVDAESAAYAPADGLTFELCADSCQFGRDFELGDYCTVIDRTLDILADLQIVNVEVSASAAGTSLKIGVGLEKASAYSALRRMILNGR